MTHDVMYRLASIQPMPRGERLAQYDVRCGPIHNAEPLWERMAWGSRWVSGVIGRAANVRRAAAPLRKAREERQGLNNVCKLNQSLLRMLRSENDGLREELKRIQSALLVAAVVKR